MKKAILITMTLATANVAHAGLGEWFSKAARYLAPKASHAPEAAAAKIEDILAQVPAERSVKLIPPLESLAKLSFIKDLTAEASEGKFFPLPGREIQIKSILESLVRSDKGSVVLTGEAGVGKTSIVKELARRIAIGEVPPEFANKRVLSLDLGALQAEAPHASDLARNLTMVINEIKKADNNVILFIDEIHNMASIGGESAGNMGNLLKVHLTDGLHVIGASTTGEYNKVLIKSDMALKRRLPPVEIPELSRQQTIEAMKKTRPFLLKQYGLQISDETLISIVDLSKRYTPELRWPDSALTLVHQAAGRIKTLPYFSPARYFKLDEQISLLEDELHVLQTTRGAYTAKRIPQINTELADLRKELQGLSSISDSLKAEIMKLERLKTAETYYTEQLAKLTAEKVKSRATTDAMAQQNVNLREIKRNIESQERSVSSLLSASGVEMGKINRRDVAEIIAEQKRIPVSQVLEQPDVDTILKRILNKVKWQDNAVKKVMKAITAARVGLQADNKPVGVFMFAGPPGVGKTEIAKQMAEHAYFSESNLTRLDGQSFKEKHAVSRATGAPPGYLGFDEGGEMTESMKKNPRQVLLIDELEKAHPDFAEIFLRIMDEGIDTDAQGNIVDYRNAIIIFTTNVLQDAPANATQKQLKEMILERAPWKKEFLDRLEVIVFNQITGDKMKPILSTHLDRLRSILRKQFIDINLSAKAEDHLLEMIEAEGVGARPLIKTLNNYIRDPLAEALAKREYEDPVTGKVFKIDIQRGDLINVDYDEALKTLRFSVAPRP